LIVGQAELITRLKKNPIFRTVRVDKVVFAALEKLLGIYLDGRHQSDIKLWQILATSVKELRHRAEVILKTLGRPEGVTIEKVTAFVGGGALPERALDSIGVVFSAKHNARGLLKTFSKQTPPVVGRIEDDRLVLDLKAVDQVDIPLIIRAAKKALHQVSG